MLAQVSMAGLIPVIKVAKAADALPLCRALADGGLPVAEITFRTDAAEEAIRLVREALPGVLLGAGTVLTTAQADRAWAAGAGFLVTPGFNPAVVRHCVERGYTILPGCSSPTDIEAALALGLKRVKFFPAEALGGTGIIKALLGPYQELGFVPTGGINQHNLLDYLAIPQVLACGGSWMVPESAIQQADWAQITRLAQEAVNLVLGLKLRRVGLYHKNTQDAQDSARSLGLLTGWPLANAQIGYAQVGEAFEILQENGQGSQGLLVLGTRDLRRARWQMQRRGFDFIEMPDRPGTLALTQPIAGFEVRLEQDALG